MLPTAETADIMKKPIHKEIIILQSYFKSMRAKIDRSGGRCWGQVSITPGVLHDPATSKGLDFLVRESRESPSFLCQGLLGKPGMSNTKEK